ncbi:MAG: type-F conjugative transfer system pilin assembly protein TrbC [Emcibacter sp.]|nr:type-F conjugative transfer system pilin assembly protein TrbC [Emcibacter sp.]
MKQKSNHLLITSFLAIMLSSAPASAEQEQTDSLKQAVEKALPEADAFARKLRTAIDAANAQAVMVKKRAGTRLQHYEKQLGLQGPGSLPANSGNFDLDRLLNQNIPAFAEARNASLDNIPPLLVMVSLSMPDESLKALIQDVGAIGGQVILRGFYEGSLKATAARLQTLVNKDSDRSGVGIDPRLFQTFDVKVVPTFIVPTGPLGECNTAGCVPAAPVHDRISGNITLRYALETLHSDGTQAKSRSAVYLKRLEASK